MPSWPDDIHGRVRAARAYSGLSLEALSDIVEIGRNTLGRTEAGKRIPKRGEIREIALATRLPYEFFTAEFDRLDEISAPPTEDGLPELPGELGKKHLGQQRAGGHQPQRRTRRAADERRGAE